MGCILLFKFEPTKLNVKYKDEISTKENITPRRYTLTHSDETGELFLTIGEKYDFDSINYTIRDDVLASWEKDDKHYLMINVDVDNESGISNTIIRDKIFREELPLAITAIVYGDNLFLENNKELYDAPIIVKFNSNINEYDTIEEWGKVMDYKYELERDDGGFSNYNFNPFPMLPPVQPQYYNKFINNKKNEKCKSIENALIAILDPYISSEVYTVFGKNSSYCLKKSEVLEAKSVNTYGPCTEEYEIVIGLKIGKRPPFYNNMIITFLITEKGIKIKNVKTPRV